jgi:hypothetical protein
VRPLWSRKLSAAVSGLVLARERGWLLAATAADGLTLFDGDGATQARRQTATAPLAVAAADDGSAFAALGPGGELWALGPDLALLWEQRLPLRAQAVALEPLGHLLAVADAGANLHVFDRRGHSLWRAATPRPLRHLAFAAEKPLLVGAADFGLLVGFGPRGQRLWWEGLVVNVGGLAVSGPGEIALACFSEGLFRFGPGGERSHLPHGPFCRLVALSYNGDQALTADEGSGVRLRARDGGSLITAADLAPSALALDALARQAALGLPDGRVLLLDTGRTAP